MRNLTHRIIDNFEELSEIINSCFDNFFWSDYTEEELYEESKSKEYTFVLFEQFSYPCALIAYRINMSDADLKDNYEILLFEVVEKDRGLGEDVINYFKKYIASDRDICGFSMASAARFWRKVSTEIDEDIYNFLEKDNFESEYMMFFKICN